MGRQGIYSTALFSKRFIQSRIKPFGRDKFIQRAFVIKLN